MPSQEIPASIVAYRKKFRETVIPKYYNGVAHLVFNFASLISICVYSLTRLNSIRPLEWLTLPVMLVTGNLAVFLIHKYPLHKRLPLIGRFTYDIHSKEHHQFYTDEAVIYESTRDWYILFFPPFVVIGFALGYCPALYFLGGLVFSSNVVWLMIFTSALYFLLYEVFHYISHLPQGHWALKFPVFKIVWQHHVVHHNTRLMHDYNFNIVFPIFDYVFGTVYRGEKQ